MSERATRDRIGLLRAALALTQERDVEKLLGRIMDEVTRVLDADRSTLFLYDSERRELFSKIAQRAEVTEIRLPIGRGLAGHVAKTGTAMAVDDVYDDPRFTPETDRSTGYRTKTVACAPLLTPDGRTVGVLEVMNKREGVFDPDDVKLLTAFAAFSAVAIENARLYDEDARKSMQIQALNRQLKDALERQTKRLANVEQELESSKRELGERFQARNIVGRAPAMVELQRLVDRVAGTDAPVLIQGESGTGKELLAKAIHFGSRRAAGEFVAENCAAVAETLLEAELFGHKKGAFTGADRDRQGLFEIASGGTLFLDEVGDMSLEMQKKLLRALQEGEIRPVGARDNRKVDVRILAATNKDLDVMMKEGTFREDLYYRLNVVRLRLPALRERREDIPILVEFFLDQIAKESGRPRATVSDRAMKALVRHGWPGNVRELQNEIRRAAIMADGLIDPEHLSPQVLGSAGADGMPTGGTLKGAKLALERKMIEAALKRTGGNVAAAARELGVHRPQLSVLIGKHKLARKGEEA
ncbi:MAG: transcriptional regulator containing GAF AAA-type ATPase and DNA binding [Planctomycetota bacterium]|nr:MAG: transcriptional regulator containing GAF AAA-type ATPase and DNA binding [Planctomycetota bacterium]